MSEHFQSVETVGKAMEAIAAEFDKASATIATQSALLAQMAAALDGFMHGDGHDDFPDAWKPAKDALTAYTTMSPDPQWQRVPENHVLIRKDLVDAFPEINMSNYSGDDVMALNNWGIEVAMYDPFQRARGEG